MERWLKKKKGVIILHEIEIAVVCHQGLGSSLWLKIQVEKITARNQINAYVFQTDLDSLAGLNPHIAVGVDYLENRLLDLSQTVVTVSNILDNELEEKLLSNPIINLSRGL